MTAMKRRTFLLRALGALAGTLLARRAGSQALPPPDSLGTRRPADSLGTRPGGVPADTAAADTPARARPAGPSLLLAVAGDTTLGYDLEEHADELLAAGTPRDQIWPLYARGVREVLESADLALVNLECPFTERGEKLPKNFNFRARPELVEILKQGGVGVVTLANNHLMDY